MTDDFRRYDDRTEWWDGATIAGCLLGGVLALLLFFVFVMLLAGGVWLLQEMTG